MNFFQDVVSKQHLNPESVLNDSNILNNQKKKKTKFFFSWKAKSELQGVSYITNIRNFFMFIIILYKIIMGVLHEKLHHNFSRARTRMSPKMLFLQGFIKIFMRSWNFLNKTLKNPEITFLDGLNFQCFHVFDKTLSHSTISRDSCYVDHMISGVQSTV